MKTNSLKNLAACLFIALMFYGCDDAGLTLRPDAPLAGTAGPTGSGPVIGPTTPWVKLPVPSGISYGSNEPITYTFKVNGAVYTFLDLSFNSMYKLDQNTQQWTPYNDVYHIGDIFESSYPYHFTHGTKLYWLAQHALKSLDITTGQQQVLASFPGHRAMGLMICVVGTKVYFMGGSWGAEVFDQFWEYDINGNHWTNKGALPGGPRATGAAFAVGDKIYLGFGQNNFDSDPRYLSDWSVISPATGARVRLRDFPGNKRAYPVGSVFGGKIILGWGFNAQETFDDVWEYDMDGIDWKSIPKCPGREEYGEESVFGLGGSVYVVRGRLKGFWKYNKLPWQIAD